MRPSKNTMHQPDYALIAAVGAVVLFGLIMLTSAGSVVGFQKFGDSYFYVKRQAIYAVVGGVLFFVFSRIPLRVWKERPRMWLAASIVLLLLVFLPGIGTSYGTISRSWVNIGGIFSFQPSEIAKMTYLLFLAAWFERVGKGIRFAQLGLVPFLGSLAGVVGLVALQPDLGTAALLAVIAGCVYFFSGARWQHVASLFLVGVLLIGALAYVSPERFSRITTFFSSRDIDALAEGYHIKQALIGIGTGGWFGKGLGQSRQKFIYLPEVAGDSIFVVIAEELGFIFTSLFLMLMFFIGYRLYQIARLSRDDFGRLFAAGVAVWILVQSFVNIGAMLGVLPLTGIPLPFVSFGGTALVSLLAALGIVVRVSQHTHA